ncbi:unnamed protein product [Bursaphelenchus okinawaensis]|uniref:39S ribosomal protein L33, mitochondrial n=1 Tax=Bursaphelenchus okinawaensis TaxID=465554 RepID=A0A811LD26_9BILA|nr:unnamed protein product [Bursaphelenchus okinawaensis]CAG9120377.1 unnamed protein product [Bursaphelenchus okinawaensis]
MGAKSRFMIVQLKSVISGTTKVWVRERAGDSVKKILFDPALGKEVLFTEFDKVKGKADLKPYVRKMYGLS